jgi:hypothetical protein
VLLLDTVLTIWMAGLMTHVGDDSIAGMDLKSHVVIVTDRANTQHKPTLVVLVPDFAASFDLQPGDRITFMGLPPGRAKADRKFQDYAPSLTEPITNALLDDAPKMNQQHKNITASLEYPNGDLNILVYHTKEANYILNNKVVRHQCVPRLTQFKTTATNPYTLTITHAGNRPPTSLYISTDALVLLVNQPPPHDSDHQPSKAEARAHFANYEGILKRRNLVTPRRLAVVEASEDDCGAGLTLPDDFDIFDLPGQLFASTDAFAQLATAARSSSDRVIFLSANPACANTDWP